MRRLNYEELCAKFNKMRMENQGAVFSSKHLLTMLKTIGINKNIGCKLCTKGYIESHTVTGSGEREYHFSAAPLHKEQLRCLYENYNKNLKARKIKPIEPMIEQLKAAGYQISRPVGFDEERFKADHPELYSQYQLYETI